MTIASNYINLGYKKTVLLIHGLGANSKTWNHTIKFLHKHHYNTLTIDLAGHGESSWKSEYNYKQWVDDIRKTCQTNNVNPDYIIAHSLGGLLALQIAVVMNVEKMLLIDPLLHIPSKIGAWFFKIVMRALQRKRMKKIFKQNLSDTQTIAVIANDRTGLATWDNNSLNSFKRAEGEKILTTFVQKINNDMKIILFKPKHSLIVKKHHLNRLAFLNLKVFEIDKAGHNLHRDKPREYLKVLRSFIENQ